MKRKYLADAETRQPGFDGAGERLVVLTCATGLRLSASQSSLATEGRSGEISRLLRFCEMTGDPRLVISTPGRNLSAIGSNGKSPAPMIYLLLAILGSGVIPVIFRAFAGWRVNLFWAIPINYVTCVVIGNFLPGHSLDLGTSSRQPWIGSLRVQGILLAVNFSCSPTRRSAPVLPSPRWRAAFGGDPLGVGVRRFMAMR